MALGGATAAGSLVAAQSPTAAPSPVAAPSASYPPVDILSYQIVSVRPHDSASWTEGLALDAQGRLFESKGIAGESELRQVDPLTGRCCAASRHRPASTTRASPSSATASSSSPGRKAPPSCGTPTPSRSWAASATSGEGWGLCYDGSRLVMSNGSAELTFRDPDTFEVQGSVPVTYQGQPVAKINELECVDGSVWANIWETPYIIRIDPGDGTITGVLDGSDLPLPNPAIEESGAWLNGIAHDPVTGHWLLTGKLWPSLFEVAIPGT